MVLMFKDETAEYRGSCLPITPCPVCKLPSRDDSAKAAAIWKSIQIKYLSSLEDLENFINTIHMVDTVPDLLAIDNYDQFFNPAAIPQKVLQMNALLYETALFLSKRTQMIPILVSHGSALHMRSLSCYSRWFRLMLNIEKLPNDIYRIMRAGNVNETTGWATSHQALIPFGYSMRYQFNKSKQLFRIHSIEVDH